jgi:rare lipoprotein A
MMMPPHKHAMRHTICLPGRFPKRIICLLSGIALLTIGGCATVPRYPRAKDRHALTGIASYYGRGFHGKKTASGERFSKRALTAAHRTLPFGTRVRVTNLDNGKSVVVKINDRGPFKKNRIIDLSQAAAKKIDMMKTGTARVKLKVLK